MRYATQQDMVDRFGEQEMIELTDRDDTGAIDATVINKVLDDASAEIDGYIGGQADLAAGDPPAILVSRCCDIARYRLYDEAASDQVSKRYDDAIAYLKAVAKGDISLGRTASGAEPTPAGGAEIQSGGRVFSRDSNAFI